MQLTTSEIRSKFLKFFESKGHTIVPSSSLVPNNDPTLMFVNSGMVQFKDLFTGAEKRNYTRATSSQRCVRAGGKHNDLENVGHTARHHTFFEMMGNFSFGDYFKEDVIPFAWEFLTSPEWMALNPNKLYVTIYHTDDEAYEIWRNKVGLSEDRIIRIETDDNFWSMGDTGPCGPSSEIFYDHGEDYWGGLPGTPEEDGDRYIEIWNLVFMQYDRQVDGKLQPLPQTGVDTGCGLERLTAVMQHVNSNYDIDLFQTLIQDAANLAGVTYGENEETDTSLRVLSDHLRSMCFLMVDGVMPSNEGRGYVLRRIMRRAMRHMHIMGEKKPFIYKLVPSLVKVMSDQYPELARGADMITDVIKMEEERFGKTLSNGLKLLAEEIKGMKSGDVLSGAVAFKLYDTYGFPLDLTEDALKEHNIGVDEDGFKNGMEEQRTRARMAGGNATGQDKLAQVWFDVQGKILSTEFLGYSTTESEAHIIAMVKDDAEVTELLEGDEAVVVTNQTPFYAESGGQVGDIGEIVTPGGRITVTDTQKIMDGTIYQHKGVVSEGMIKIDDTARMQVDAQRRSQIVHNHSATHLMHAVLKDVLGDHVFQKGSLVADDKLRFDFSHPKGMTAEEITAVEEKVNNMIWQNALVIARVMPKEDALESGAEALFGEKYGDEVRVLTMGGEESKTPLSVELCGGIHVNRTGDIGLFKILHENSVSAGVRRIEAVTGQNAFNVLSQAEQSLKEIAQAIKVKPEEIAERVISMAKDVKALKKENKKLQRSGGAGGGDISKEVEQVSGVSFLGKSVEAEPNEMREMVSELKNQLGSGVIVLAANNGEKSTIVAGVTNDLTGRFKASDLANAAAATLGGKGGGKPDMAMAGGKAGNLGAALDAAKECVAG